MNHIFYQTKTKYSNTGDVLINHALISALREYGSIHANCSQGVPEEFLSWLGLREDECVFVKNEVSFFKTILRYARKGRKNGDEVYIFSGPGELCGGSLRMALRNAVTGLVFPVLRLMGVKIIRIGRSVGPITRLMAVSEWFRCLSLTHYFVRDTQSLQRCRKNGIKKVRLSPDLSWIYDSDHPRRVNHTNVVMVNLRHSIYDHDVQEEFIEATLLRCEELLAQLDQLMAGQMKVCVAYQTVDDKEFAETTYNRLKDRYDTTLVDHRIRLDEFEKYYGAVDFHISNRMHSLLAGYKYGSLPLALVDIQKHVKVVATFKDCEMEQLLFEIYEPIDAIRLTEVVDRRDQLLEQLYECEKTKKEDIIQTLDEVFYGNGSR